MCKECDNGDTCTVCNLDETHRDGECLCKDRYYDKD